MKTKAVKQTAFEAECSFNSGYWDARYDAEHGLPRRDFGAGNPLPAWSPNYCKGYRWGAAGNPRHA